MAARMPVANIAPLEQPIVPIQPIWATDAMLVVMVHQQEDGHQDPTTPKGNQDFRVRAVHACIRGRDGGVTMVV